MGRHDGSVPAADSPDPPAGARAQGEDDEAEDGRVERGREGGRAGRRVRYFECAPRHGVFVRPERVEVGDFAVLDELGDDEDMEEI